MSISKVGFNKLLPSFEALEVVEAEDNLVGDSIGGKGLSLVNTCSVFMPERLKPSKNKGNRGQEAKNQGTEKNLSTVSSSREINKTLKTNKNKCDQIDLGKKFLPKFEKW